MNSMVQLIKGYETCEHVTVRSWDRGYELLREMNLK